MPSFRSPKAQSVHAVSQKVALGTGRHDHRDDGKIHSVGTARGYGNSLKGSARYMQDNRLGDLRNMTREIAMQYLTYRAAIVSQKTLDLDRQALQMHLGIKLDVIKSEKETHLSTRSYTAAQIERIASAQSERNALATQIAHCAGLRAHELLTIRPASEQKASTHREWSTERFTGRVGERYTVEGKGGLVREVLLLKDLAARLEATRLVEPRPVVDREVNYTQHYDIGGGKAWSQSFSAASQRELGFPTEPTACGTAMPRKGWTNCNSGE